MLPKSVAIALCLLLVPLTSLDVAASDLADPVPEVTPSPADEGTIIEDGKIQLIVGHGDTAAAIMPALIMAGGELLRTDTVLDFSVVRVPLDAVEAFRSEVLLRGGASYVQRDGTISHMLVPDDPHYAEQWGAPAIGMEGAWDIARGDHNVTVAVLDTGVDYTHPDLDGQVCGTGRDFINDDMDAMDDHGHGTHVSGTIAAHIGNGVGVAGMADVCIMPVKVLSAGGWGAWSGLASALVWTADQGVDVISMSLGGCPGCDPGSPMTEAIQYAAAQGVLIIAAAGNAYCDAVGYPAAYPEVIAVAALEAPGDDIAYFSSCGPEVEVAAPGHEIISTVPTFVDPSGYDSWSGTSMATPHVSGVAALVMSIDPALDADDVRCMLAQRADDLLAPGRDEETGYGRIDALDLVLHPQCLESIPVAPALEVIAGDLKAHLAWNKPFAWGGVDGYDVSMATGDGPLEPVATLGETLRYTVAGLVEGETYRFAVSGRNSAGQGELSTPVSLVGRTALDFPVGTGFESGLGEWTATGLWHLTGDRVGTGATSAYYGRENGPGSDDNSIDTGSKHRGSLTSPPIRVPASGPASLVFWQHASLGWSYEEHPRVQVADENDATAFRDIWEMAGLVHEGTAAADLSALAGQVVWVRFHVDTLDDWNNEGEGWYVDEIALAATSAPHLAPLVDIVYPEPGQIAPGRGLLGVVATDPNGQTDISDVSVTIDGVPFAGEFIVPEGYLIEYTGLTTGDHAVVATVHDGSGLSASAARSITVDGDGPIVSITTPAPGAAFGCALTVAGQASDAQSGVYYVGVGIGVDPWSWDPVDPEWHLPIGETWFGPPRMETDWTFTIRTPYVAEGPVRLVVLAIDAAGNRVYANQTIERDDAICVPKVTLSSPAPGTHVSCSVHVEATAIAPEGQILESAYVLVNGLTVDWYDLQGPTATISTDVGVGRAPSGAVDVTVIVYDDTWSWGAANVTIERDGTDCRPSAVIESPSPSGTFSCAVEVTGRAFAGPEGELERVYLHVDGAIVDQNGVSGSESVFTLYGDLVTVGPGRHALRVEVVQWDGLDNISAPVEIFRDDRDCYPTGDVLSPDDGEIASCTIEVTGTAQPASPLGLWRAVFRFDGEYAGEAGIQTIGNGEYGVGLWTGTALLGSAGPGNHTLRVQIWDRGGHYRTLDPITIERDATDCAPDLVVDTPEDGTEVRCAVRVTGTATDEAGRKIREVEIIVDDYPIESFWFDSAVAPFDAWIAAWWFYYDETITVRATNDAGGVTEVERAVTPVDTDCDPVITVTSPAPGENVTGTSTVAGYLTVPDGPLSGDVEIWIGGVPVADRSTEDGTFRFVVDWTRFADGPTQVTLYANLDSGGFGMLSFPVVVDNAIPPRLDDWSHDGTVVCSAKVAGLGLKDACGAAHLQPVEAGLTGGRLVLTWATDEPTGNGLDHLALRVTIGARAWQATSVPGDDRLVLELSGDGTLTDRGWDARIEVMAGTDPSPLVLALDEDFHIDAQWAYGGAEPTV